jgi:hypothetical protein
VELAAASAPSQTHDYTGSPAGIKVIQIFPCLFMDLRGMLGARKLAKGTSRGVPSVNKDYKAEQKDGNGA